MTIALDDGGRLPVRALRRKNGLVLHANMGHLRHRMPYTISHVGTGWKVTDAVSWSLALYTFLRITRYRWDRLTDPHAVPPHLKRIGKAARRRCQDEL